MKHQTNMTDEEKLHLYTGNGNPFKVPDKYFDDLTEKVMGRLPRESKVSSIGRKRNFHMLKYASAAIVVAIIAISSLLVLENSKNEGTTATDKEVVAKSSNDSTYIDDALDYALVDNDEIVEYLTENDN